MGVDISLHIEIRQHNKWHLMKVTSPQWEETDHEYEIFETEVFNCRYRHFSDFLAKSNSHRSRNKEILSEELQKILDEDDNNSGSVYFCLTNWCIIAIHWKRSSYQVYPMLGFIPSRSNWTASKRSWIIQMPIMSPKKNAGDLMRRQLPSSRFMKTLCGIMDFSSAFEIPSWH